MKSKYKKMILKVKEKEEEIPAGELKPWTVYILRCSDNTLYTGITNDLEKRVKTHNAGRASKYTRLRVPVKVVYSEIRLGRGAALVQECKWKALSRPAKEKLIEVASQVSLSVEA